MDVSIVIPAHNAEATLGECLAAVTGQFMPAGRSCEIIVVDDGSTDATAAICKRYPVTLIEQSNAGASAARNAGVRRARGTWVAFTDADCIPSRRWAWTLAEAAESAGPRALGAAGKTVGHQSHSDAARFVDLTGGLDAKTHLEHPTFPFAPSCNLLYRRSALLEAGGFDERFSTYETQDLHHRLTQCHAGLMIEQPRALVLHRHRATWGGYYRQQRGYGRGNGLLYLRYPELLSWSMARELAAWGRIATLAPGALFMRGDAGLVRKGTLIKQLAYRVGFVRTYYSRRERVRLTTPLPAALPGPRAEAA